MMSPKLIPLRYSPRVWYVAHQIGTVKGAPIYGVMHSTKCDNAEAAIRQAETITKLREDIHGQV